MPEVFGRWMETRPAKDSTARDYDNYIKAFLRWAKEQGLKYWRDLRLEHLQMFARYLERNGSAKDTVRLYAYPVRSAAKWASLNWRGEFENFAEGFTLVGCKRDKGEPSLRLNEVADLLSAVRESDVDLGVIPGLALQAFCGLRVTEMLRLSWDRVGLVAGTIKIDGEVKNDPSRRTLPMPALVVDILSETPRNGSRVVWAYTDRSAWRRAVRRVLKRWNPERMVSPKTFRKTLSTEMRLRRWNRDVLDLYYGHAEKDVLGAHYIRETFEELQRLFREEVTMPVDEVLTPWRDRWNRSDQNVIPLRTAQ